MRVLPKADSKKGRADQSNS